MQSVPKVQLSDGRSIPQIGLGVFKVDPAETEEVVSAALEAGYRHIDTATVYENEEGVGRALAKSEIPREEVFVTTKVWNDDQGYDRTLRAFDRSLDRLGLDWVDLYLIHWPAPQQDLFVETWQALERLKKEGRALSIGVSNFRPEDLERLRRECEEQPVLNQIELHPLLAQKELREYHSANDIVTEAWAPLAQAAILGDPIVAELAAEVGKTTSQVVLRWHVQLGNVVIPKTVNPKRMAENLDIFDFSLTPEQMETLDKLNSGTRLGADPTSFQD
jgi:2,5-diketo-D-gluconate reductase A